jgi:hypothetical protein
VSVLDSGLDVQAFLQRESLLLEVGEVGARLSASPETDCQRRYPRKCDSSRWVGVRVLWPRSDLCGGSRRGL